MRPAVPAPELVKRVRLSGFPTLPCAPTNALHCVDQPRPRLVPHPQCWRPASDSHSVVTGSHVMASTRSVHPAFRLEVTSAMGTVAVATRRIAVGEVVFVEAPLLTWTRDDTADLLRAYDALPPASRALLRGLYHPNVEDAEFLSWGGEAKLVADTGGRLPAPVPAAPTRADILLLLAVARFNAHAYTGHPAEKKVLELSRTGISCGDCHPQAALYATLSRMEHSCVPNLSYSSKLDAGAGRLTAIRPISSGDHLSLSYIDNPWVLPTALRRAQLYDGFAFFCRCSRCAGPDTARSVLCTKPCGGLATPLNADDPVWRCTMCNLCVDKMYVLAAEAKVKVSLAAMHERNVRTLSAPEEAAELVDDASRTLSPLHWLTLRASRDLEQLLSSHAHSLLSVARIAAEMGFLGMARAHPRDVGRLRIQAVAVSVASIKAVECLAASCGGGWPCRVNHPPVAEVIEWVFWMSQDLLEVPRSPPSSAAAVFRKYQPLLGITYGADDPDVMAVAVAVMAAAPTKGGPRGGGRRRSPAGEDQREAAAEVATSRRVASAAAAAATAAATAPQPCARARCTKTVPAGARPPASCPLCGVARYCCAKCQRQDQASHARACLL